MKRKYEEMCDNVERKITEYTQELSRLQSEYFTAKCLEDKSLLLAGILANPNMWYVITNKQWEEMDLNPDSPLYELVEGSLVLPAESVDGEWEIDWEEAYMYLPDKVGVCLDDGIFRDKHGKYNVDLFWEDIKIRRDNTICGYSHGTPMHKLTWDKGLAITTEFTIPLTFLRKSSFPSPPNLIRTKSH